MEVEVSELVARLQQAYEDRGLTQQQFADALDVGRNRARNWIKGHNDLDLDAKVQKRIAMFLGVSLSEVLRLHGLTVSDEVPDTAALGGYPTTADGYQGEAVGYLGSAGPVSSLAAARAAAQLDTAGRTAPSDGGPDDPISDVLPVDIAA